MRNVSKFLSACSPCRFSARRLFAVSLGICAASLLPVHAQQSSFESLLPSSTSNSSLNASSASMLTSSVPPGTAFLFDLERKFAAAVAEGGGKSFATFFDPAGVTIENRQAPWIGQAAIAAHANWSPEKYQLTWQPEGGELSPAGDMGYTWGHYQGRSLVGDTKGNVQTGRYMSVWKKEPDGSWKVLLDTSNEDPPEPECKCSVNGK